jgi:hypothetical protein
MRYLALLLTALLVGCGGGSLTADPDLDYYDFEYREDFSRPYASLATGEALELKARFVWAGDRGQQIDTPQHVVLAFTQAASASTAQNDEGERLWTHGAGAFVGEHGLAMELWFRDDQAQDGFDNDAANALVWSQDNGRCMRDVLGVKPTGTYCLSDTDSPTGYITSAPDFVLQKGVAYVLHVRITPGPDGWKSLHAVLYQESGDTFNVVQRGFIGFPPSQFFPVAGQPLQASVARTPGSPGEPLVDFVVF